MQLRQRKHLAFQKVPELRETASDLAETLGGPLVCGCRKRRYRLGMIGSADDKQVLPTGPRHLERECLHRLRIQPIRRRARADFKLTHYQPMCETLPQRNAQRKTPRFVAGALVERSQVAIK